MFSSKNRYIFYIKIEKRQLWVRTVKWLKLKARKQRKAGPIVNVQKKMKNEFENQKMKNEFERIKFKDSRKWTRKQLKNEKNTIIVITGPQLKLAPVVALCCVPLGALRKSSHGRLLKCKFNSLAWTSFKMHIQLPKKQSCKFNSQKQKLLGKKEVKK